jgi:hypothetical protein
MGQYHIQLVIKWPDTQLIRQVNNELGSMRRQEGNSQKELQECARPGHQHRGSLSHLTGLLTVIISSPDNPKKRRQ